MSDAVFTLPPVTITGKRKPPSDDVSILIAGRSLSGWLDVRITRGIERMPNDFELRLTERYPGEIDAMIVKPGDACQVLIGADVVVTGYVDRVMPAINGRQHSVTVSGRGKCQDLVDCAAEWPGGQISGSSVLEIAQKLAAPYGIKVSGELGNTTIPQFNLMLGETAFEVIERLCRISQLLCYETPKGDLLLSNARTDEKAASGFVQGVNVQAAAAMWSMDQRYSLYQAFRLSFDPYSDIGEGGNLIAQFEDTGVKRRRLRVIIAEVAMGMGADNAKDRAQWEAARRYGRSGEVRLTTDAWRDSAGYLYEPNTQALVDIPTLKLDKKLWTISEVTYRKGDGGTACDIVMMASDAFLVQPTLPQPLIPAEIAGLPANLGRPR